MGRSNQQRRAVKARAKDARARKARRQEQEAAGQGFQSFGMPSAWPSLEQQVPASPEQQAASWLESALYYQGMGQSARAGAAYEELFGHSRLAAT